MSMKLKLEAEKNYSAVLLEFIINVSKSCPIDYWRSKADYAMINAMTVKELTLNKNKCDSHIVLNKQPEKDHDKA